MRFIKNFSLRQFYQNNKQLFLFILLMSVFRSAFADWYTVPTGSMQPTIEEGDRIVVNKMAYDLRLPFSNVSLLNTGEPKHGEIIVFESKAANMRLIKRVVGLPGDTIAMKNEVLYINGIAQTYQRSTQNNNLDSNSSQNNHTQNAVTLLNENLVDITHQIKIDNNASNQLSSFGPVIVPQGHYLVLGDNRRHSADSRVYGFVPREELKGKATAIAFSVDYDNYYLPKKERFFQSLYL
ncbi:signal peptidase I [Colwellia sp. D2M02]|uniref:Signal peptidase I n=1 Tax=Colwellia asteriadis TaxID=517723 RepID=A0ABN1L7Q7_9GAMM|nr:signal peptidase I [Colwellia sp. D2M02]MBU2894724.1 signal peptidase I [Colwellia sp. D2M02]